MQLVLKLNAFDALTLLAGQQLRYPAKLSVDVLSAGGPMVVELEC